MQKARPAEGQIRRDLKRVEQKKDKVDAQGQLYQRRRGGCKRPVGESSATATSGAHRRDVQRLWSTALGDLNVGEVIAFPARAAKAKVEQVVDKPPSRPQRRVVPPLKNNWPPPDHPGTIDITGDRSPTRRAEAATAVLAALPGHSCAISINIAAPHYLLHRSFGEYRYATNHVLTRAMNQCGVTFFRHGRRCGKPRWLHEELRTRPICAGGRRHPETPPPSWTRPSSHASSAS